MEKMSETLSWSQLRILRACDLPGRAWGCIDHVPNANANGIRKLVRLGLLEFRTAAGSTLNSNPRMGRTTDDGRAALRSAS